MTTTPAPATVAPRVDISRYAGKETLLRLIRQEFRDGLAMLESATDEQWQAQTPCALWQVRDLAGHLLDAAYGYLGYFKQAEHGWPTEEPLGMRSYGDALGHSALAYRDVNRWEVLGRLDACTTQLFRYFDELTEDQWAGLLIPHRWVGPVPAFMMAAFQLMDYSVHNWDLRTALGAAPTVDDESTDVLVPMMFGLFQLCFTPELAEDLRLTIGVRITTPREEDWTIRIGDGALAFEPGAPTSPDATFTYTSNEFALDAYQRVRGGVATGDETAVARFRRLFFTV